MLCAGLLLGACGGGDSGDGAAGAGSPAAPVVEMQSSRDQAARFLTQATFGPTDADLDRVMAMGYAAWIDEQLAKPAQSHHANWEAADARIRAANATSSAGQD